MGKVRHEGVLEGCVPMGSTGSAALFVAPGDVGPLQQSSTGMTGISLQMALAGSSEESHRPWNPPDVAISRRMKSAVITFLLCVTHVKKPSNQAENVKHDLYTRMAQVSTKNILQNLITKSQNHLGLRSLRSSSSNFE